jgi:hypothetical protein
MEKFLVELDDLGDFTPQFGSIDEPGNSGIN